MDGAIDDLAAIFESHGSPVEITGEGETPVTDSAPVEDKQPEDTTPQVEKPAESDATAPKAGETDSENELAVDDSGKRYVPEKRFKDIYGNWKKAERELEQLKNSAGQPATTPAAKRSSKPNTEEADRVAKLETQILRKSLPQFDPYSPEYSEELDNMGYTILKANPGMTKLEAAEAAIKQAERLAKTTAAVKAEARTVKALQSDQGITNRVMSREPIKKGLDEMNEEELLAEAKSSSDWWR